MNKTVIKLSGIALALSTGVLAVAGVTTYSASVESINAVEGETVYTMTFDSTTNRLFEPVEGGLYSEGPIYLKSDLGNDIFMNFGKFDHEYAPENGWHNLKAGGHFGNIVYSIVDIVSLSVVFDGSASLTVKWSESNWSQSDASKYEYSDTISGTSGTCYFSNSNPNFFWLENTGTETVGIVSMVLTYKCSDYAA